MEKQSIVFEHWKNGKFLGYRADTFGSLTKDWAKLYTYSENQVEIVLSGVRGNLQHNKPLMGEVLKNIGANPIIADLVSKRETEIYENAQKARAFEVRVVKAPSKVYERFFNVEKAEWEISPFGEYPENFKEWCNDYENHETIETHYFSLDGQLNPN